MGYIRNTIIPPQNHPPLSLSLSLSMSFSISPGSPQWWSDEPPPPSQTLQSVLETSKLEKSNQPIITTITITITIIFVIPVL